MKEEYRRIMKMVQEGKISAEDAAELIEAFHDAPPEEGKEEAVGDVKSSKEDVFAKIVGQFENVSKEIAHNVNFQDFSNQVRHSVTKGAEILKDTIDQASKGARGWGVWFGQSVTRTVDLPLTIDGSKTLRLEGVSGDIRVEGGFDDASIHIEAVFRAYSEEEAEAIADRYMPVLEESDHHVVLRHNETDHLSADVMVRVPRGVQIEVKSVSGDVEVLDTHAGVRLQGTSGNANFRNVGGVVDLSVTSGDIRVTDSALTSFSAESKSGEIRLDGVDGMLNIRSSSGDVRLKGCSGRNISVEAASGNISLDLNRPVVGSVNVRTVSGDVLIEVPDGSDCRVNLNTLRGQVTNAMVLIDEVSDNVSVRGRLGEGSGTLDASVVNGNVHFGLRDSTVTG